MAIAEMAWEMDNTEMAESLSLSGVFPAFNTRQVAGVEAFLADGAEPTAEELARECTSALRLSQDKGEEGGEGGGGCGGGGGGGEGGGGGGGGGGGDGVAAGSELFVDCSFLTVLPAPRRPAWFAALLDARTEDGYYAQLCTQPP